MGYTSLRAQCQPRASCMSHCWAGTASTRAMLPQQALAAAAKVRSSQLDAASTMASAAPGVQEAGA
jgi:hypothetical protein